MLAGIIIVTIEALLAVITLGNAGLSYFSNRWSILTSNFGSSSVQYLTNTGVVSCIFEEAIPVIAEVDYVATVAAINKLSS